jgi:hypothetical protein
VTPGEPSLKYALLFLFVSLLRADILWARQPGSQAPKEAQFLEARVTEFEIRGQTLLEALWKLARGPEPFGFGFEKVLKERLSDPEIPNPSLSLRLQDKSIREILDALCKADPRYTWTIDGTTVDVFPRAITNDGLYLLNRKLPRFDLKNATDVDDGLLAIHRQLPPPAEQIAISQAGGADPYPPEPWTVSFENLTVRQIVNRLAEHGGRCGIWIFGGARDFRAFGFFNTLLCSKQPPSWAPKSVGSLPKGP